MPIVSPWRPGATPLVHTATLWRAPLVVQFNPFEILRIGTDGTRVPHLLNGEKGIWRSLSSREILVTTLSQARDDRSESAADLSRRLGLPFSNLALLTRALTHRSYVNENPDSLEDNERLEFLGDAVLDFVVGAWVYNRYPEMQEGELTKIRSAIVRNDQLANFARRLSLGRALRLGRGEFTSGGRQRDGLLGSLFEALIGAVYLDKGLGAVEKFVAPLLEETQASILEEIHDPKSRLQEWAQSEKLGTPQYITIGSSGPDHAKVFEVEVRIQGQTYGTGQGSSKHVAARIAAQAALESLGLS